MNIAITGHRPNKLGNDYNLTSSLIVRIRQSILDILDRETNSMTIVPTLITGMALGIDTLFAQIAIAEHIPFIAAIPMKGQELRWPGNSQAAYHIILRQAKQIVCCNTGNVYDKYEDFLEHEPLGIYQNSLMQKRNVWMVDNCDPLIAVWDGTSGGTKNCVDYAIAKDRTIIRINPAEL